MTSKTLSAVFTSLVFAGAAAYAQGTTQQQPYTSGQTGSSTQQQPYTSGQTGATQQQQPYTSGQTGTMTQQQQPYTSGQASQARQYSATVTELEPNNEITVETSDGKKHKFDLSDSNTRVSSNVSTGSSVIVTEGRDASGRKVVTIMPSGPSTTPSTQGTTDQSGQTRY